jgi:hypothetical protein
MIGESTPRGSGAQNGTQSWQAWFKQYFTMINDGDYSEHEHHSLAWIERHGRG